MGDSVSGDLYERINGFAQRTDWLHGSATAYAKYGIFLFALMLLIGWWFARARSSSTMATALIAPVSTVVAVAVNQPIVRAVGEARPYVAHPAALVLVARSADPSFPSDHAVMAGAVATGLLLVSWRIGLVALACATAMAATRVYVGAHYPHDVVAGLALGAVVALLAWWALRRPMTSLVQLLRGGALRVLVATPRPIAP